MSTYPRDYRGSGARRDRGWGGSDGLGWWGDGSQRSIAKNGAPLDGRAPFNFARAIGTPWAHTPTRALGGVCVRRGDG